MLHVFILCSDFFLKYELHDWVLTNDMTGWARFDQPQAKKLIFLFTMKYVRCNNVHQFVNAS